MKDADVQRMFRQLDLILNLIQETRREMNLLKQGGDHNADDPLIPNRQLAEILDLRPKSLQYYRKKKILEAVILQKVPQTMQGYPQKISAGSHRKG